MFLYIVLLSLQWIQLGKQRSSHKKIYFWRHQSCCQIFPCFPQLFYWNCLKADNRKGNPVSETFPFLKNNLHFSFCRAVNTPTLTVAVFCDVWASDFSITITSQEGKGHSNLAQLLAVSVGIADAFLRDPIGNPWCRFFCIRAGKKI